ncbi:MAG TPA: STAS domain-containing protein [Planctomycetota bacterium]|jgi:anti-sigma B factor antagonist
MAKIELTINQEMLPEKGVFVLHLTGLLNAETFSELEDAFAAAFDKGANKGIVDLSQVYYMSSAGAGTLIGALAEAQRRGGNLVLMKLNPNVQVVFDLMGIGETIRIFDDLPAALATF